MTLKKAVLMKELLENYIKGLEHMLVAGKYTCEDLCDLINLNTAIGLALTEQLSKYNSAMILANSLKKQMDIASLDANIKLYKELQKEYESVVISAEQLLIENQFKIDDTLMSQFCSYAD